MTTYAQMTDAELTSLQAELQAAYDAFVAKGLSLNMARGKPSPAQLELARPMLDVLDSTTDISAYTDADVFNYGVIDGIPEARALMASLMEVPTDDVIVMGNSSLNIMYDTVARAMTHGVLGSAPWSELDTVRFLCPVPGYDRHFGICEHFGIEMIDIPMGENGPDMDLVESLVSADDSIKGIWCVPKYANPTGICYADEVVDRLGALCPAAADFRIFWDNAYAVHHLDPAAPVAVKNIKDACAQAGHPDLWYMFASTSKISFAGAGIAAFAASPANIAAIKKDLFFQTIGHDKTNQLRHVMFFKDRAGIDAHMARHAAILAPKFACVLETFERELTPAGIGAWTTPKGGYFISFDGLPDTAQRTVALAKAAGVTLTGAGATYPYRNDPSDSNIRIAPSYPSLEELAQACELFTLCVKLASIEKILAERAA
jgi:DNA-binding transcriptional MocR family regulator